MEKALTDVVYFSFIYSFYYLVLFFLERAKLIEVLGIAFT